MAATPVVVTLNLTSSLNPTLTPLTALARAQARSATLERHASHATRPSLMRYYTGAFGLRPSQLSLARLTVGSRVLAGTILGRLARAQGSARPHLLFALRPADGQTLIDPRPFLDAWSQLATVDLHRHGVAPALFGPNAHGASAATLLAASEVDVARAVLQDPRITIPGCERATITSGSVDRRVLASLELLARNGIDATVSGNWCSTSGGRSTAPAALRTGQAVAITDHLMSVPSLAIAAARALRPLHGSARLSETVTGGHAALEIVFVPERQPQALAASAAFTGGFALSTARWTQLDARLVQIAEPRVPVALSAAALRDPNSHAHG